MTNFEKIFTKALEVHNENNTIQESKDKQQELQEQEIETQKEEKRINKIMNVNPETDCYSKELFGIIKKYNFSIDSYEKFTNFSDNDYEPTLETYYCSFGNWQFEIHNQSDTDIHEGIFAVRNIKNKFTNEEVDFYTDLGCRNTSEPRLKEFIDFINYNSLKEYINSQYNKYLILPELLRNRGYNVSEVNYGFELNSPKGHLQLDKKLFIKIYHAWNDDFKLVVTNDKSWDVNSANDSIFSFVKKAYYFTYNSENDIDELCKCIEAFKEEQLGHIGFYENDTYYSNSDIDNFFESLRDKNDYYKDCWNHYQIQIERKRFWDARGYNEENSVIVNKYKGLEIFYKTELTFNDAAQWTVGEYANKSIIVFEYDKRKNPNQCRLQIDNYIYKDRDYQVYNDVEEEWVVDVSKKVLSIELFGTFTELMSQLKMYVLKMCEIHEINL